MNNENTLFIQRHIHSSKMAHCPLYPLSFQVPYNICKGWSYKLDDHCLTCILWLLNSKNEVDVLYCLAGVVNGRTKPPPAAAPTPSK